MGPAFHSSKVSEIIIPSGLSEIGYYAFGSNDRLENMFIPENITFINNNAFSDSTNATIYCPSAELCAGKGSDNIQVYSKDENGVYQIDDMYFSSPENMLSGTICNNTDGTCAAQATAYKEQEAEQMAGGALCDTKTACLLLMDMAREGAYCSTVAACRDWIKANGNHYCLQTADGSSILYDLGGNFVGYKGKRIYTIEEANAVTGKKNRVSIKYR